MQKRALCEQITMLISCKIFQVAGNRFSLFNGGTAE
jgi:hypothetical protein